MHFALPPRKSSHPPPFTPARSSRFPTLRRSRVQTLVAAGLVLGGVLFLLSRLLGGGGESIPFGTPKAIVVTVLQPDVYSAHYIEDVKENRKEYAAKHGYKTFFPESTDYWLEGAPRSWAKIPAMRHAMAKFPHSTYFWFLDQNSLIMNPDLTIEAHVMDHKRMDTIMLRDQSIVPPDSVIKTFPQLRGEHIDLAITQDQDGLSTGSFIIRRGDWAKFFLDTWLDPLYRSYNFQKAETHALEHIVQWHPTILSKLAIIPQRLINAYNKGVGESTVYKDGDFVIRFPNCEAIKPADCEAAAVEFATQWRTIFRATR